MIRTGPNGEPFGYPSLSDEILEQQVVPDVGNVLFVRAFATPPTQWNMLNDNPHARANLYPDDLGLAYPQAAFNQQVGPTLYNLVQENKLGAVDYVQSDASLSVQSYRAPESRFIDQVP